jgi:hypothetical protein
MASILSCDFQSTHELLDEAASMSPAEEETMAALRQELDALLEWQTRRSGSFKDLLQAGRTKAEEGEAARKTTEHGHGGRDVGWWEFRGFDGRRGCGCG